MLAFDSTYMVNKDKYKSLGNIESPEQRCLFIQTIDM